MEQCLLLLDQVWPVIRYRYVVFITERKELNHDSRVSLSCPCVILYCAHTKQLLEVNSVIALGLTQQP